jgi:protein-disulfide isomerase
VANGHKALSNGSLGGIEFVMKQLGWLRLLPALAAVLQVAACGDKTSATRSTTAAPARPADAQSAIVARIDGRAITATEADAPVRLVLHDLEMQQYRVRRQALELQLLRRLQQAPPNRNRVAEILLQPPLPPRVEVPVDPARVRPVDAAPVTILAFCSFESPHCTRLQMTLAQVLPLYPGLVRYAERDLPLAFHRNAGKAAEAARCAQDQDGRYWRFHDALYAAGGTPDRPALQRAAGATDLDLTRFAACLDSDRHAPDVAADVALASTLGLSAVPAVFVNGLYASPDVQPGDLVWLIEHELTAAGRTSPRASSTTVATALPVQLQAIIASPQAGQGLALLAPALAPDRARAFREGDAMTADVVIRRIASDGLEIVDNGRAEHLGFGAPASPPPPAASQRDSEAGIVTPHRAVPVTLDRAEVLKRMSDRIALEAALQPVPMTSGGYHQLRVETVAPGSLYELLEFQPGDVILSVNEQPVHEASNPLWDALEREGEVRVRVIRQGGLAQHFTYRFTQ